MTGIPPPLRPPYIYAIQGSQFSQSKGLEVEDILPEAGTPLFFFIFFNIQLYYVGINIDIGMFHHMAYSDINTFDHPESRPDIPTFNWYRFSSDISLLSFDVQ